MTTRPPKRATAARRIKAAELARELGVRPQAIAQLIKAGKVKRDDDGLIDVAKAKAKIAQSVRAFGKTAAAVTAGAQPATVGLAGPATTTTKDVLTYQSARASREQEEAQTARIKRLQLERRLIDRDGTIDDRRPRHPGPHRRRDAADLSAVRREDPRHRRRPDRRP
jgi:hypothetical protein